MHLPTKIKQVLESEKAILSTILAHGLKNLEIPKGFFDVKYFEDPKHVIVANEILNAFAEGLDIDSELIFNKLVANNRFTDKFFPYDYQNISDFGSWRDNLSYHLNVIFEAYGARLCIQKLEALEKNLRNFILEGDNLAIIRESRIFFEEVNEIQSKKQELVSFYDACSKVIQDVEERIRNPDKAPVPTTGFKRIDQLIYGFVPSNSIILAGRPGSGKTALALNMIVKTIKAGNVALFFSLEMSKDQICARILSHLSKISSKKIMNEVLTNEEHARLLEKFDFIEGMKSSIFDSSKTTLTDIRIKAMEVKRKQGRLDLIVIDYLSLIKTNDLPKHVLNNKPQLIGALSSGIKDIAKDLNCCILTLCQMNRKADDKIDNSPGLSDLKDSGDIEADADQVIFIYKPSAKAKEKFKNVVFLPEDRVFKLEKNRHGDIDEFKMRYVGENLSFYDH